MRIDEYIKFVPEPLRPATRRVWWALGPAMLDAMGWFARVNPRPIIMLGCQKSGTTAIATLLGAMTGRSVSIDLLREMHDPAFRKLRTGEMAFGDLIRRNKLDFSRDIFKDVDLAPFHDDLARAFPASPFVYIVRDPRHNIRSLLNNIKVPGNLDSVPLPFEHRNGKYWDLVLDGGWLGLEGENYIEMLAARWNLFTDMYLAHGETMLLARYEDFLRDKEGEIARLATALRLTQVRSIEKTKDRQFQPKGDRTISMADFYGATNLARIERICGERMEAVGYTV